MCDGVAAEGWGRGGTGWILGEGKILMLFFPKASEGELSVLQEDISTSGP